MRLKKKLFCAIILLFLYILMHNNYCKITSIILTFTTSKIKKINKSYNLRLNIGIWLTLKKYIKKYYINICKIDLSHYLNCSFGMSQAELIANYVGLHDAPSIATDESPPLRHFGFHSAFCCCSSTNQPYSQVFFHHRLKKKKKLCKHKLSATMHLIKFLNLQNG